jgi:hypothetical protein
MIDVTTILSDYLLIPIVLLALITGYILKHAISNSTFENRWIPVFVTVEGIIVSMILTLSTSTVVDANAVLQAAVAGGISGAASSGLYDAFAAFIDRNSASIEVVDIEDDSENQE